jgi:predicted ArsR family transcriptional regulator
MTSDYQPDMFAERHYPHSPGYKARDTAQAAATQAAPAAGRLRKLCLAKLATDGPLTADDCAELLGIDKLSIRPRFSELAALGQITDTGQRGFNTSGRRAIIWGLV